MSIVVEQVPIWLVLPLRQRVLRPHQRIVEVGFPGDEIGTHFAAFDETSMVVGVVSLIPNRSDPNALISWRLRGMATTPERQGSGVGRLLMEAVLFFTPQLDPGGIWCAARIAAVGFYERFGFVTVGAPYVEPDIGPHIRMERVAKPAP